MRNGWGRSQAASRGLPTRGRVSNTPKSSDTHMTPTRRRTQEYLRPYLDGQQKPVMIAQEQSPPHQRPLVWSRNGFSLAALVQNRHYMHNKFHTKITSETLKMLRAHFDVFANCGQAVALKTQTRERGSLFPRCTSPWMHSCWSTKGKAT